jgi:hypothetical protein
MTRADMQLRDVAWTALSDHRLEPGQQVNLVRLLLADAEAGGMTLRTSDQRALRNVVASTLVRIPDGTTAPHQAAEFVTTCMNHLLHLTSEQPQFLDANLRGSILRLGVKVTSWPHITDAQQLAVAAEVLRSIQKFPDAVATPVLPELTLALASRGSHG